MISPFDKNLPHKVGNNEVVDPSSSSTEENILSSDTHLNKARTTPIQLQKHHSVEDQGIKKQPKKEKININNKTDVEQRIPTTTSNCSIVKEIDDNKVTTTRKNPLREFLDSQPTAIDGFLSYEYGFCPPTSLKNLTGKYIVWEEWSSDRC